MAGPFLSAIVVCIVVVVFDVVCYCYGCCCVVVRFVVIFVFVFCCCLVGCSDGWLVRCLFLE
jgi:hypothetical protein